MVSPGIIVSMLDIYRRRSNAVRRSRNPKPSPRRDLPGVSGSRGCGKIDCRWILRICPTAEIVAANPNEPAPKSRQLPPILCLLFFSVGFKRADIRSRVAANAEPNPRQHGLRGKHDPRGLYGRSGPGELLYSGGFHRVTDH